MSDTRDVSGRRNLQFRRTPLLAKAAVTAAIVICSVTLIALHVTLQDSLADLDCLSRQAAALEQENLVLTEKVKNIGSVEYYLQIAAEKLGLVDPDTIIIESE